MKQRYLKAGHKQIPVTEEVYLAAAAGKKICCAIRDQTGLPLMIC